MKHLRFFALLLAIALLVGLGRVLWHPLRLDRFGRAQIEWQDLVHIDGRTYYADTYVSKDYRKKGIAKSLCQMAMQWLEENEVGYVELKVLENNQAAHNFWQGQGFCPATRVYGKKLNKTEE